MAHAEETLPVNPSLQDWIQQGEQLFQAALDEFRALEAQIADLESKLTEKQEEVNRLAVMLNKPPVDGNRVVQAELMPTEIVPAHVLHEAPVGRVGTSSSNANIARALTGKFGR